MPTPSQLEEAIRTINQYLRVTGSGSDSRLDAGNRSSRFETPRSLSVSRTSDREDRNYTPSSTRGTPSSTKTPRRGGTRDTPIHASDNGVNDPPRKNQKLRRESSREAAQPSSSRSESKEGSRGSHYLDCLTLVGLYYTNTTLLCLFSQLF